MGCFNICAAKVTETAVGRRGDHRLRWEGC
jgi:hypothetical protein